MTIPNILSLFRIALIPVYVFAYMVTGGSTGSVIAGIVLIVSGLTDLLDGYIARHFNQISTLGKVLDPLADKLTQITVLICLCITYFKYLWSLVIFTLVKELLMMTVGYIMVKRVGNIYGSRWFGKVTTFMIYAAVTAFTMFPSLAGLPMQAISIALMLMLAVSLMGYGFQLLNKMLAYEKENKIIT